MKNADVIVIGAGAAGLMTALALAQKSNVGGTPKRVIILSETAPGGDCSSKWAQGGLAAAVGADDTPARHAIDTLKAAAGTADRDVVNLLTAEAPDVVETLRGFGVRFDAKLNREACHTRRRVLRAASGDGFGREMMRALTLAVQQAAHIEFISFVSAERLLRDHHGKIAGVLGRHGHLPAAFTAPAVVLASGGCGALYAATTNPLGNIGRGLALAARAGAVLSDLEFVQFHPTALDIGEDPAPLASEALRGEGAYLLNSRGERFCDELASRDSVTRSLYMQQQRGQKTYLDCRHFDVSHFTALIAACKRAGLDPQRDLIPVTPAAHYHMGGVATDLNGRSSVEGLWACGEVAATGLHGANRLASNSLMEALVMGTRVAADIAKTSRTVGHVIVPALAVSTPRPAERERLRQLMTDKVGVVRDRASLTAALQALTAMKSDDAVLADMALVAQMITQAALAREESRGAHYRTDFAAARKEWQKRSFITLEDKIPQENVA